MIPPDSKNTIECENCHLRLLCFPSCANNSEDRNYFNNITKKGIVIPKNSTIFNQGDYSSHIYIVRSGNIKITKKISENLEQVIGFYLPGDIIEIENINSDIYQSNAVATQRSSVCSIQTNELKNIKITDFQFYLLNLAIKEIQTIKNVNKIIHLNSRQKIAIFLYTLISRYKEKKICHNYFPLPMSKKDISNFLGVTPETFSRILTQFKNENIITSKGNMILILDEYKIIKIIG
ncbi:Crp/Fnr family transcriptional regulator [Acinetobacter lactucae]|uniref:Crp/Fnr family transcriptional regulator n=1 Tax=Acinetobacter lactucae TaxID=1785128 RepID=UPI00358DB22C